MNGTELIGDINYDLSYQRVKIRVNGQSTTLQEKQLASMVIFIDKYRHTFQQVALKNEQGEVSFTFAKMIYRSRNNFSLFKEYIADTEDFDINPRTGLPTIRELPADLNKDAFNPNPKLGNRINYRLFLADSEGHSHPISGQGFSKAYGPCLKKIKKFMARNKLSVRKEAHLVRIIRYADSLKNGCREK